MLVYFAKKKKKISWDVEFILSWIMWIAPKHNHLHLYTRKAEKDFYDTEEQGMQKQSKERIENSDFED